MYLARWQVQGNPPREQLFQQEKTVQDYQEHLEKFAKEKLLYFEYEALD